jgi:hypothetical protein
MKAVISQSMYFPWVGLLEQVRLSDIFIHYDDVQYARGFYNRVQVKTQNGSRWLTIPLRELRQSQNINEVLIDERTNWRRQHRDILRQAYFKAPYRAQLLEVVDEVFSCEYRSLADLARMTILVLSEYFELAEKKKFLNSTELNIQGSSSQRLHDLCVAVGADSYITGHGARNYLDHHLFERSKISVEYMRYQMQSYPQLHGEFTPYVTALDLIANCGKQGAQFICSGSINWREFLNEPN